MNFEETMKQKKQKLVEELKNIKSSIEWHEMQIDEFEEKIKYKKRELLIIKYKTEFIEESDYTESEKKNNLTAIRLEREKIKNEIYNLESHVKNLSLYLHDLVYRPEFLLSEIEDLEKAGF